MKLSILIFSYDNSEALLLYDIYMFRNNEVMHFHKYTFYNFNLQKNCKS